MRPWPDADAAYVIKKIVLATARNENIGGAVAAGERCGNQPAFMRHAYFSAGRERKVRNIPGTEMEEDEEAARY